VSGAYDAEGLFHLLSQRPVRGVGVTTTRQGKCNSQALLFLTSAWTLHNVSLVLVCSLRGRTTAFEDPASVTDEMPARDSAGHCGPADSGLPCRPPPYSD